MGIQIDLIIPPIIVALLVIVIFRLNAFIMETSIDNRLSNDMQNFSEVATRIVQEELKSAGQILEPSHPDTAKNVLKFVHEITKDEVYATRSGEMLEIVTVDALTAARDTVRYSLHLSSLWFDLEKKPAGEPVPYYLNVRIVTESDPVQHVSKKDSTVTVRGFAETEVYLRNVHRKSLP